MPAMTFAQRFKEARLEKGLSQSDVARYFKLSREAVSQWERGQSQPPPERMSELARFLGRSLEWLALNRGTGGGSVEGLPLWGDVAAGVWIEPIESQEAELERVPVAPDPHYPLASQYALRVRGNSVNRIAKDGNVVVCVDLAEAGLEPRPGDLVLVERRRGGLVEATVKRLRKAPEGLELWPESDDPAHQEKLSLAPVKGEAEIQIKAVIIGVFTPVMRGV
jgi:transcriptional regulator with XRE-family HTH domain